MKVDVLRQTEQPERLVCQAARGDYFEGYVGDTEYAELMEDVSWDESDLDGLVDIPDWMEADIRSYKNGDSPLSEETIVEAQTKSFIEKQLSRGHYGPWEHPSISFAVEGVSRVTMAQITRHRHMTFDIQSMRYADFSEQEIVTPKSLTEGTLSREKGVTDVESREKLEQLYEMFIEDMVEFYERMVRNGVPKEDARFFLPQAAPVNMTFSANPRSLMHFFDLRKNMKAQWEAREFATQVLDECLEWAPLTFEGYEEYINNNSLRAP